MVAQRVPSILSLTRSPTSFTSARPLSRSLNSGQVTLCSVEARSFLMYVFNWSESNLLGRGDVAPERGLVGDRIPGNAELAMMAESDGTGAEGCLCCGVVGRRSWRVVVLCLCPRLQAGACSVNSSLCHSTFPPSLIASCPPLLFLGNPLRHHHMMLYTHCHLIRCP
jgi:hypothetical protein